MSNRYADAYPEIPRSEAIAIRQMLDELNPDPECWNAVNDNPTRPPDSDLIYKHKHSCGHWCYWRQCGYVDRCPLCELDADVADDRHYRHSHPEVHRP